MRIWKLCSSVCVLLAGISLHGAQNNKPTFPDARMLRYADVSARQIVFVYAGDIWVVPKNGGLAQRLSSPRGEETFPRFSPDGTHIAFSGNYDGNTDVYVMPVTGGLPRRLTYHGAAERMLDWYPDGKSILFASTRHSEKDRFHQLYRIPVTGGLPEKLPMPYGEFGSVAADGKTLAYVPITTDFSTWKRYRGGMNPAIWLFNLETYESKNITGNETGNSQPMWHRDTLYFVSDRDDNKRANLWAYEKSKNTFRQVTKFEKFDVRFPSIGPEEIVFENGGRLFLMNLGNEKYKEVNIQVLTDRATLKPRLEEVSRMAHEADISPTGKRVVIEGRGEIFTLPAEHGVTRNLTRSSGVAERYPTWSPDGKYIAYFSDRTGEYQLTLRPADGSGSEQTLTTFTNGFRYRPQWSPDSKKIAFIDHAMRLHLHDIDKKQTREIGQQLWLYHGDLNRFKVAWSRDSRWLAYALDLDNQNTAIALYDVQEAKRHQVTSGYYDDRDPVFDPDGKYLYYQSGREFTPVYSDLDNTWIYPNTRQLVAVALRKDVVSPLSPRNDDEGEKEKAAKEKEKKDEEKDDPEKDKKKPEDPDRKKDDDPEVAEKKDAQAKESEEADVKKEEAKAEEKAPKKEEKKPKTLEIDVQDFESRAVILPPKAGNYADLAALSGKLLYRKLASTGATEERSTLYFYDLEKRESKTILDDVDDSMLAAKNDKLLVRRKSEYAIIEPKENQKFDKKVSLSSMEAIIDPASEWKQLFADAWRLQRDYFYDPGMHGVNWQAMRERYGSLLEDAVTRFDIHYIIGELIAELSSSHTYRSGGDVEAGRVMGVGYVGADFTFTNGAYRIAKILRGGSWDAEARAPLAEPGVDVKEGDYLLAVNGMPLEVDQEPYAAFQGLADKPVFLTVNSKPVMEGSREVLVKTLSSEYRLRHLAWIESNRKKVEQATDGKIGYIYVPDTGRNGQNELVRQFRAQFNKDGLIIDERFNSGGQIPDRFVEMLSRKTLNYWGVRDGADWPWPRVANSGPKAMLINGWSGSGGDCFPFYFKEAGLGPLIGSRTWGGLIGITGSPGLVDGGSVTVPTFGIYNTKGEWIIEGYGVDPDIAVVDDPSLMAKGQDPQLDRAIKEVLDALKKNPPSKPLKPKYPVRAGY